MWNLSRKLRCSQVTAAILAGAVGRSAVDLYADLEELRGLKVCIEIVPSCPLKAPGLQSYAPLQSGDESVSNCPIVC